MNELLLLALAIWWSLVVVIFALGIQDVGRDPMDKLIVMCVALCWPIIVPFGLLAVAYHACVGSVAQIKADLKNRRILAEFEEWHRDKYEK